MLLKLGNLDIYLAQNLKSEYIFESKPSHQLIEFLTRIKFYGLVWQGLMFMNLENSLMIFFK